MRSILSEYRIANADITLRYDATADDLIDVIEGNRQVSSINQSTLFTLEFTESHSSAIIFEPEINN